MVRSAVKPDGTHAVPRTRPHLNQIMVGLVLLSMGILIVYMYRIIDDLHNEQKDLRGQIVAMANREWPHLLSHPGSDKFLESKDEAVARSGQSNRFAKTMGSYEESRRPVEHIVEEVHPGYMAAFEVPRGDPESKRRLAGFYTIGTAAGVGCYEVADAATTTYDVSSATACSSNSCPDCFITPGTVSQDMTITINSCSSAQWIRSTTRTGIWEYKFINTHATYTMSITDNSGIGITYKVPPQSHVTAWCAASSGTADRLRFPSTTVPTLSVDSGFTLSAGAFDASASSGAFDTSSGTVTLRGNTVVNGANTFATGTGTVSLNGATTVADSTAFNVGATAGSGGVATFYGQVIIGASGNGQSQSLMLYGDFTQADDGDGTAKNFATATGTVTINGDISQASGKSITQSGAGAITSGSGAVQLNGAVTITGSNTFTSGTGTVTLKGNTLVDSTNTFTVGTAGSAGATILYGTLTVGDSTGAAATTLYGALTQNDVGGTPSTITSGTGAIALNGDVDVADSKYLHMLATSSGTFQTGVGTVTLNGNTQIASTRTFTTGSGAVSLQGATTVAQGIQFNVGTGPGNTGNAVLYGPVVIGSSNTNAASRQLTLNGHLVQNDDLDGTASQITSGTGTAAFNGDVTVAFNKDLTMSNTGTGTFTTGTGAVTLNGATTVSTGNTFTITDQGSAIQCNQPDTAASDLCKASR